MTTVMVMTTEQALRAAIPTLALLTLLSVLVPTVVVWRLRRRYNPTILDLAQLAHLAVATADDAMTRAKGAADALDRMRAVYDGVWCDLAIIQATLADHAAQLAAQHDAPDARRLALVSLAPSAREHPVRCSRCYRMTWEPAGICAHHSDADRAAAAASDDAAPEQGPRG